MFRTAKYCVRLPTITIDASRAVHGGQPRM